MGKITDKVEYPPPEIRPPVPVENAHPDVRFSPHLHNDWTQVQLGAKDYGVLNLPEIQHYEGEIREDKRMFDFEEPGDY
jgi:hypothetical protein